MRWKADHRIWKPFLPLFPRYVEEREFVWLETIERAMVPCGWGHVECFYRHLGSSWEPEDEFSYDRYVERKKKEAEYRAQYE